MSCRPLHVVSEFIQVCSTFNKQVIGEHPLGGGMLLYLFWEVFAQKVFRLASNQADETLMNTLPRICCFCSRSRPHVFFTDNIGGLQKSSFCEHFPPFMPNPPRLPRSLNPRAHPHPKKAPWHVDLTPAGKATEYFRKLIRFSVNGGTML